MEKDIHPGTIIFSFFGLMCISVALGTLINDAFGLLVFGVGLLSIGYFFWRNS